GLNYLGQIALLLGRYDEARSAFEESVILNISVGTRGNLGGAYEGLGSVAQAQGQHQRAVEMFRKGVDTYAELGLRFYVGQCLAELGRSLLALDNDGEAELTWHKSLQIAAEIQAVPVALLTLIGFAELWAKKGDTEHALEISLIISNHTASSHDTCNRANH